jgi:hypothetical protein
VVLRTYQRPSIRTSLSFCSWLRRPSNICTLRTICIPGSRDVIQGLHDAVQLAWARGDSTPLAELIQLDLYASIDGGAWTADAASQLAKLLLATTPSSSEQGMQAALPHLQELRGVPVVPGSHKAWPPWMHEVCKALSAQATLTSVHLFAFHFNLMTSNYAMDEVLLYALPPDIHELKMDARDLWLPFRCPASPMRDHLTQLRRLELYDVVLVDDGDCSDALEDLAERPSFEEISTWGNASCYSCEWLLPFARRGKLAAWSPDYRSGDPDNIDRILQDLTWSADVGAGVLGTLHVRLASMETAPSYEIGGDGGSGMPANDVHPALRSLRTIVACLDGESGDCETSAHWRLVRRCAEMAHLRALAFYQCVIHADAARSAWQFCWQGMQRLTRLVRLVSTWHIFPIDPAALEALDDAVRALTSAANSGLRHVTLPVEQVAGLCTPEARGGPASWTKLEHLWLVVPDITDVREEMAYAVQHAVEVGLEELQPGPALREIVLVVVKGQLQWHVQAACARLAARLPGIQVVHMPVRLAAAHGAERRLLGHLL